MARWTPPNADAPAGSLESSPPAQHLREMLIAATQLLGLRVESINRLNVFPVPDGDTGTNLLLTMRAALDGLDPADASGVGPFGARLARAALIGARGNSGVILSQFWRGFASALQDRSDLSGRTMAAALAAAAAAARAAVVQPADGTMLTVASALAAAATTAAQDTDDLGVVLDAAASEAQRAVTRTIDQLAVLRQAGVVDAGAVGLATILEAMARAHRGEAGFDVEDAALPPAFLAVGKARTGTAAAQLNGRSTDRADGAPPSPASYGYCTQFLIRDVRQSIDGLRQALASLGDSVLVVGEPSLVRVHLHTGQAAAAIELGRRYGAVEQVSVDDMTGQHERWCVGAASGALCGLVAVSDGEGFAALYRSLGAGTIVPGAVSPNPSAADLLQAVGQVSAREVLVLPNHPKVHCVADQVRRLAALPLTVAPTRNLAEGVAASLAFRPDRSAAANLAAMKRALTGLRTGQVTATERATRWHGQVIAEGAILGLVQDRIAVVGTEPGQVVVELLEQLKADQAEVITMYAGEGAPEAATQLLLDRLRDRYPAQTVELVPGGQPRYPYVLACE